MNSVEVRALEAARAARAAKSVTVRKVGRRYDLFAPGETVPFASKTSADDACGLAWTYARYRLKNDSIGYAGAVLAEGFDLAKVRAK